jgi:hypothetical protein
METPLMRALGATMSLTFGFKTPHDLLEKARRELAALETAAMIQDETEIADALYNFAVTTFHVKDWLKSHRSDSYVARDVEDYVARSPALSTCRDLCNAGKHFDLTYEPTTEAVVASANSMPADLAPVGSLNTPIYRVKVVRNDGSRHEVVAIATQALNDWERFFELHKI